MFWWLAQHTLMATVLAGIVALLCRWGRIGPALQHGLWLIVLLKLLVPPFVAWPWALPLVSPSSQDAANSQLAVARVEDENAVVGELQELVLVDSQAHGSYKLARTLGDELQKIGATSGQEESPAWRIPEWVGPVGLTIWVAGSVAMAVFQFVRIVKFRRLLKRGRSAPSRLVRQVQELATMLAVRRPGTRVVPGIGSPFVWGLHRAQLLWPTAFLGRLADTCWRSVIAHELAHLRRRDHWVAWLQLLAECVWWWNPLFWYVRRQLRLNAELACDAWVVSALPEERRAYAEALIEVTEHVSQTASLAPALGISSGARQAFERRLTMIMGERVPCKVPIVGMVVMGLLGLAAIPGWAQVQVQVQKVQPPEKQESKPPRVESLKLRQLDNVDVNFVELIDASPKVEKVFFYTQDEAQPVVEKAKSKQDPEKDRKLRELEKQIEVLLKEVQNLRSAGTGDTSAIKLRVSKVLSEAGQKKEVREVHKGLTLIQDMHGAPATGDVIFRLAPENLKTFTARVTKKDDEKPAAGQNIQYSVITGGIQVVPELKDEVKIQEHKAIKVQVLSDDTNKQKAVTKGTYKIEVEPKQELHVIKGDVQVPIFVGKLAEIPQIEKKRVLVFNGSQGEQAQTLSRVTYKLSHEKAEALATFLRENVKGSVVETKVTEGGIVITTTPEAQHTIGGIVALLRSKTDDAKGGKWKIQAIELDNGKAIIIDNDNAKKK